MSVGSEVDLGPGHMLGTQLPPKGAQEPPLFGPCLLWPNGRPSQLLVTEYLSVMVCSVPVICAFLSRFVLILTLHIYLLK